MTEDQVMLREYRSLVDRLIRERDQLRAECRSLHEQLLDLAVELEALGVELARRRAKAGQ